MDQTRKDFSGQRILIVAGNHAGQEGVCLGKSAEGDKWAVTPDDSSEILELIFEKEFGLLLDMSGNPRRN